MEENKGVHIDSSALEKYNEAMNEAPSAYSKPAGIINVIRKNMS